MTHARLLAALGLAFCLPASAGSERPPDRDEVRPETSAKTVEAGSPWIRAMTGMAGGTVNALALDPANPGTIYAGTDKGLFRSTDSGMSWSRVALPTGGRVEDVEINANFPENIHLAVPCAYVRSTDGGQTWTSTFTRTCVENVDLDPTNNRVLVHNREGNINVFAAAEYSTDGGATFTELELPDTPDIVGIAMDVIHGVPGGYLLGYASSTRQLYKTVDNGATWQNLTANVDGGSFLRVADVASRPGFPNQYLLTERSASNTIMHLSTDAGVTWNPVATGAFSQENSIEMQFDPEDNALVHYMDLRSTNGGFDWVNMSPDIGVRGRAFSVIGSSRAPNRVYAGGEGFGIEISEDAGGSWARSNRGLDAADVTQHAVVDGGAVAIAEQQGIYRSMDFGSTWSAVQQADLDEQNAIGLGFSADGREGFATFSTTGARTLATTTDGGESWQIFDITAQADSIGPAIALGGGAGLVAARAGGEGGVLQVATNGSVTGFSAFSSGVSGFAPNFRLSADPANTDRVLAGFTSGSTHVFASTDAGASWTPAGAGVDALPAEIQFDPTIPDRAFLVNDDGVYESTDGGASFMLRSTRPSDADTLAVSDRVANLLLAGERPGAQGGLSSSDGGLTWRTMTSRVDGGGSMLPRMIRFDPGSLRIMANDGGFGSTGLAVRVLQSAARTLTPEMPQAGDQFGQALASSGGLLAVGVPGDDGVGSVYIYRREGSVLILEQRIPAPASMAPGFGQAVAIDGGTLVVGTNVGQGGRKGNAIQAAVFERLGQSWTLKAELEPQGGSGDEEFGATVAVSGDVILVGSPGDDTAGPDAGAVFQFGLDATTVTQDAMIMSSRPANGGKFGSALAINDGAAAIGSPAGSLGAITAGIVELYERVGANLGLGATVEGDARDEDDAFGSSLALSGDRLLVGAPGESSNAGAAYLFTFGGDNATQQARVISDSNFSNTGFGSVVTASSDQFAIGAPGREEVYLYDAALNALARFDDSSDQDGFGQALALSGRELAIGAPETNSETGEVELIFSVDLIFDTSFE